MASIHVLPRRAARGLRAAVLSATLLLSGCASLSGPDVLSPARERLAAFVLEGRFSLRQGEQSYAGRLTWQHAGAENVVLLASPFGQGLAEIVTDARGARLTASDGKVYAAADSSALTAQVLGYPLPIDRLVDWLRARETGAADAVERDALGRPVRLRENGWDIAYDYPEPGADPVADAAVAPQRLIAIGAAGRSGMAGDAPVELRLRIDRWTVLPSATRLSTGTSP